MESLKQVNPLNVYGLLWLALLANGLMPSQLAIAELAVFKDSASTPFVGGAYAGTEDTMLVENVLGAGDDQNFGKRNVMQVGKLTPNNVWLRHGLIRFDVSPLSGHYESIESATLRLFVSNNNGLGNLNFNGPPADVGSAGIVDLYRLTEANMGWVEGTETGGPSSDPADVGMTTWSHRVLGSLFWAGSRGASTPGVDYHVPGLASRAFDQADEASLEGTSFDFTFNDVSFIEDWIAGNNPGLLLRTRDERQLNAISFFTNNAPSPIYYPELIVEFTPIPEPSVAALAFLGLSVLGCFRIRH